jgi:hypothetical protein
MSPSEGPRPARPTGALVSVTFRAGSRGRCIGWTPHNWTNFLRCHGPAGPLPSRSLDWPYRRRSARRGAASREGACTTPSFTRSSAHTTARGPAAAQGRSRRRGPPGFTTRCSCLGGEAGRPACAGADRGGRCGAGVACRPPFCLCRGRVRRHWRDRPAVRGETAMPAGMWPVRPAVVASLTPRRGQPQKAPAGSRSISARRSSRRGEGARSG